MALRSLVALSVRRPGSPSSEPSIRTEDVDGDSKDEVVVEVPVTPLRADVLWEWGSQEDGAVAYVLDESLQVEARWTSIWGVQDMVDDGDSPPRSISCSVVDERRDDNSLVLSQACTDGDGVQESSSAVCQYDAEHDRYDCPPDFAMELFEPSRDWGTHYVAETEAELSRLLSLGSSFTLDVEHPDASLDEDPEPVREAVVRCSHVVEEPSPPLHVRATPSSRARIVDELSNGTRIELTERRGRWGRIEAPVPGWVWTVDLQPCLPREGS